MEATSSRLPPLVIDLDQAMDWQVDLQKTIAQPVVLFVDALSSVEITKELTPVVRNTGYLAERAHAWNRAKMQHGDNLWNGKIITVRRAAIRDRRLILSTAECEYKDIIFKREVGANRVVDRFGGSLAVCHAFVAALPITEDSNLIFGRVGNGTIQSEGVLDFIGGSLNLDERPIASLADIKSVLAEELVEEVGWEINESICELLSVNFHGGCCYFLFLVPVAGNLRSIPFERNKELSSMVACRCDDIDTLGINVTADVELMVNCATQYKHRLQAYCSRR